MSAEAGTTAGLTKLGGWQASALDKMSSRGKAGPSEFEAWMAEEQPRIFLLCLRLLRNREEADSATQDAFLKAHQALQLTAAEEIASPGKWLTRIAVNTCLDILRSRRWLFWKHRLAHEDEQAILYLLPSPRPGPESIVHSYDIARRISAALDQLSPRQRSVFVLRHDENRSLEEIGEILGLDQGTVKTHMFRALQKLRKELRDLYGKPSLD
jgi:RNA polymerase sigma-70 factor, ECF subfamily